MYILSDDQAQELAGGRLGFLAYTAIGQPRSSGLGSFFRNRIIALRSVFNHVNQINFAINIALNGGTVINNQANVLSIISRL
jgi:hypothetical protein